VSAGTFTLGPTGTVAAGTNLTLANAGTAATFNATAAPALGALTLGVGTTANVNESVTVATLPGTGSVVVASGKTLTVATPLLTLATTIDATLSGAGGLAYNPTAADPALLTLTGNNTFTGGVTGNANARYVITNPAAFGTGPVNVSAQNQSSTFGTPTVGFNFGNNGVGTVPNNFVLSGTTNIDSYFIARTSNGQTITLSGVISGGNAGSRFVVDETGGTQSNVLILTNPNNTFQGTVRVDFGALAITSDGALGNPNNGLLLQSNSATNGSLRFDANNITLAATRTVTVLGIPFVNTNGNNATVAGPLVGTSAVVLTKIGAGTLTLANAANTFAGPLNVGGGTLLVNGNLPGSAGGVATTVDTGATLGGTAALGAAGATRNVAVATGGTLAGGNPAAAVGSDPGNLTVNGNIAFDAGANFRTRVTGGAPAAPNTGGSSGATPTSPTNNGLVVHAAGGTLTLNPGMNVVIDGTGVAFTLNQAYSYAVAQTGAAPGLVFNDQSRFQTVGFQATAFSLNENAGILYLNFTPVPEPVTVLGLAAAGLGLASLVRRKRRRGVA
jgi:autotransporter-associated beta strand protein